MVAAGLNRCADELVKARRLPRRTYVESAVRAERLARLTLREARWWTVLDRWAFSGRSTVPTVFARAAMLAAASREEQATFWRESAADWRRRAAGEQLCGVVGCRCNGECGVAA